MLIAPSVLSLDYTKFLSQVKILNDNVDWLHFDVMDGHFVPNLTFGPDILKAYRKSSSLFLDVHLMITNPKAMSEAFIDAGADSITFHLEAMKNYDEVIDLITYLKKKYVKVGISIKPNTPVESLNRILSLVDLVLIMSVEPGFGGQKFMDNAIPKIKYLDEYRKLNNFHYLIEVDGGINDMNAHVVKEVGCDVVVAGSFVFKGDIIANIEKLKNA